MEEIMKTFLWIMLALTIIGLCWFAPSAARADAIPAATPAAITSIDVQAVAFVWPFTLLDKGKSAVKPQPIPAKKPAPVISPKALPACSPATPPPNACAASDSCEKARRRPLIKIGEAAVKAVESTAKAVGRVVRIRRC
jgi:hypothetical protein